MLFMQIFSIILTVSELILYSLKWSFRFHKPIEKRSAIVKDFNKVYLNSSSIRKNEYVKYRTQSQKGKEYLAFEILLKLRPSRHEQIDERSL